MKKYDIFGKEVNIGDDVIIIEPYYHNFVNAKVIKLTPKGFRVKYYPDNAREKETVAFGVIKGKMESDTEGKWMPSVSKDNFYVEICSECGYIEEWNLETDRNFCPNCGAKMNRERERY